MSDPNFPQNWLPEDLTGLNEDNVVTNESHPVGECTTVGSAGRTIIISPYRGCFYSSDDLVVKYVVGTTETVLSRADYRLIGLDVGRTRASSSEFGVYRFIQLTCDTDSMTTGEIVISYHAFGGQIDPSAYQHIINLINSASGGGGGGSSSTIDSDARHSIEVLGSTVAKIATRVNCNVAASVTVPRSVDGGWATIAYSSTDLDSYINFTDSSTLTGSGTFVLVSKNVHGVYAFTYDIIKVGVSYKCKLTCDVLSQKITTFDSEDTEYFGTMSGQTVTPGTMTIPMFRMVVDTAATLSTGHRLALQVCMLSDATDNAYSLYIGDKTDVIMVSTSDPSIPGQTFDAWEVGSATASGSIYSNTVLGVRDYYEVWRGNASISLIEDVSWTDVVINRAYNGVSQLVPKPTANGYTVWPYVKSNIQATAIRSFRADIYDRWQQKLIAVTGLPTIENPYGASVQSIYTCMNYFPVDNCLLEIFYTYTSGRAQMKLYASSGENSYMNKRFDLRAIYVK